MHTTMSDGKHSVEDILNKCIANKMNIIAITDHDTVKGIMQLSSFKINELSIIGGIEISAYSHDQPQIHMTGYFPPNTDFSALQSILGDKIRSIRIARCKLILSKMDKDGYHIPYSEIEEKTKTCNPSLPIIADCLLNHHYVDTFREAFDKFLGDTAPYYEPVRFLTMKEAIDLVHSFHGIIAVAHPWLCHDPIKVCEDAVALGVDGLECFPPKHSEFYNTTMFCEFAKKHNLFCSSGSDYHGINDDEIQIGNNIFPEEAAHQFIDVLKKHNII